MQVILNLYELKQLVKDHVQHTLSTEQDFVVTLGLNERTADVEAIAIPKD